MDQTEKLKLIPHLPVEPFWSLTADTEKDSSRLHIIKSASDTILGCVDLYVYNTWGLRFNRRLYLLNGTLVHADSKRELTRNYREDRLRPHSLSRRARRISAADAR